MATVGMVKINVNEQGASRPNASGIRNNIAEPVRLVDEYYCLASAPYRWYGRARTALQWYAARPPTLFPYSPFIRTGRPMCRLVRAK